MEKFLNLEFRGEGNCAIVFANPQTNHVYRLMKYKATRKLRKLLQNGISNETNRDLQENIQSAVKSDLDCVVSYMKNIIRPLMTERYVVIPATTSIPVGFGEKALALAGQARPAHRKNSERDNVDSDILYALVLPDCCFVHPPDTGNHKQESNSDSFEADDSFEGPVPGDSGESQKINRNNSYSSSGSQASTSDLHYESMDILMSTCADDVDDRDSYAHRSRDDISDADDIENSSSNIYGSSSHGDVSSDHSIYSNQDIFPECDRLAGDHIRKEAPRDNNNFTLSIEIKPKKAFMTKINSDMSPETGSACRFCMHQHLKRKSGMWPQTSSYCPLDLFSGGMGRSSSESNGKLLTYNAKRITIQPIRLESDKQRSEKGMRKGEKNLICTSIIAISSNTILDGKEVYGSDIRMDLKSILQDWFGVNSGQRERVLDTFLNLVTEVLLNTSGTCSTDESILDKLLPQDAGVQKCASSSFSHSEDDTSQGLPHGCVLERICSLQSIDDLDIEGVFPLYTKLKDRLKQEPQLWNKWCFDGPCDDLAWLFGVKGEQLDDLDSDSDDYAALKLKRFLVSKTVQDCSIIVAIKSVVKRLHNKRDIIRFQGDLYEFSIKVIDLDPKPFEKLKTYYRQASDIARTFEEAAFRTSHNGGSNSSSR